MLAYGFTVGFLCHSVRIGLRLNKILPTSLGVGLFVSFWRSETTEESSDNVRIKKFWILRFAQNDMFSFMGGLRNLEYVGCVLLFVMNMKFGKC